MGIEDYYRRAAAGVAWWADRAPPPSPMEAGHGRPGPLDVLLGPDQADQLGVVPFDYAGTQIVRDEDLTPDPALAPQFRVMVEFEVPDQLVGVLTGAAASALVPWINDELLVELFVDGQPMLGALNLAQSGVVNGTISGDLEAEPRGLFIPVRSGQRVRFTAAMGVVGGLPQIYPLALGVAANVHVRGRLAGKYWPRSLRSLEGFVR